MVFFDCEYDYHNINKLKMLPLLVKKNKIITVFNMFNFTNTLALSMPINMYTEHGNLLSVKGFKHIGTNI